MVKSIGILGMGIIAMGLLASDFASALGLHGSDLVVGLTQPHEAPPVLFRWWDLMRSVITLTAVTLLAWVTLRSKTTGVLKEELDAHRQRADRLQHDLAEITKQNTTVVAENTALKSRTDLTEVMKVNQEMIKQQAVLLDMKKTHDAAIQEMLVKAIQAGDAKYQQVTNTLEIILKSLVGQGELSNKSMDRNFELLTKLSESTIQLMNRLGRVETKVEEVHDAMNGEQPKQDDRRQHQQQPPPKDDRRGRR